ncbi:hypothetical protein OPKNFCMD_6063 [Methylobacterium crusticola]|uniref:Glycosyltransferase 2-like domain-containing protein n=1 Tax=Methylobacterium crusticola TaxID=1697972 RepID=A0ABQ4R6F6_9HYPH|nr:glycosyltransferase [Methylobacterium crusticola]GJD53288.1 hypothetical protein OPKNFCMD_6063 [Methylobacterium crusticola]
MLRLGLGVTTYNRAESLARTLDGVARFTATPHRLVVADDGSADDTLAMLRARKVPHLGGPNRGIAWNKNRVLFYLHEVARCDVVIMLEDDTVPTSPGWERPWIEAAHRFGHANLAGEWFAERFISGAGTPSDPVLCTDITGQCVSFSRRALRAVGYMDTRFERYGFEHCDHSERLRAAGFGGRADPPAYYLLKSDFHILFEASDYRDELERNALIYLQVKQDRALYRRPWRSLADLRQLTADLRRAEPYDPWLKARLALSLASLPARFGARWLAQRALLGARRTARRLQAPRRPHGPGEQTDAT